LGFNACGISRARYLDEEAPRLENWLSNNYQGEMAWMANHFDKRLDPIKLVPGAKSIISVLLNYYPAETQKNEDAPRIAKYAYGADYHAIVKQKLRNLYEFISSTIGEIDGRAFVDSAPVMDKVWAKQGGLGWIGKNSNLISKGGSFYVIGELIIDLPLAYDSPVKDYCGTCTKCIDACPTGAITTDYIVNGSMCISYFTIELKNELPSWMADKMDNWAFGCDICQDVCPWNRKMPFHNVAQFNPHPDFLEMTNKDWQEITEEVFIKIFKKSAVKRAKFTGLKRNLDFLHQ